MALYRKRSLVDAEPITNDNIENLKRLGAVIAVKNDRSIESWHDHGKVGDVVIWTEADPYNDFRPKISFAQCKTTEGLHTAELPSMLMKGENGDMYFCTKEIFDKTYENA